MGNQLHSSTPAHSPYLTGDKRIRVDTRRSDAGMIIKKFADVLGFSWERV